MKNTRRRELLNLLDDQVRRGRSDITTREVRTKLGLSASSTSNLLTRMVEEGLLDRVTYGHYVVRPLGSLKTSAAAEDMALAVGAAFHTRLHRIAYRSALAYHELITQPVRVIQVAIANKASTRSLSGRTLDLILESTRTIHVGAIDAGHGASVSDVERALLDAARRNDLIGELPVVAEALEAASDSINIDQLIEYAERLDLVYALRRLGSIANLRNVQSVREDLRGVHDDSWGPLPADPRATSPIVWRDPEWGIEWSSTGFDSVATA